MRLLLLTPPFTQINTPYPATGHLTAYLREKGHEVQQRDLGLSVSLRLFSRAGLEQVFELARKSLTQATGDVADVLEFFLSAKTEYEDTIEPVIRFLQGKDDTLALRISARQWLPEGPRFEPLHQHEELIGKFGPLGLRDKAKYLASLYLDDIGDLVRFAVDGDFQLSRYGEQLASSQASFDPLFDRLVHASETLIDMWIKEEVAKFNAECKPDVVGISCPFPGNVYGGLKAAQEFKNLNADLKTVMGGGFINTELRELQDPRMFEFIDYLTFDDGEKPLELLLEHLGGSLEQKDLLRTMWVDDGRVVFHQGPGRDVAFKELPAPTSEGLPLDQYVSMMELPNPMHRMWSDFRWNKMILAHGCYWKRCTFCDISLDYIQRYEPARVESLIQNMGTVAKETGSNGFHFVDEAAPPALLKALSSQLIEQGLSYTWWGNLRFDKQFTPELTQLMADAGCVAVTGGLEVASPRLLKLINKGVTIEQVARVTRAFSEAGIFVHAYLMYGYPTQTMQETIDSLEIVRQLFKERCIQSAHWHRFVATMHSPVGQNPNDYNIVLKPPARPAKGWFARNAIEFTDPVGCDHDRLGIGLRKALYNFLHESNLEQDLAMWFDHPVPKTTVQRHFIRRALQGRIENGQKSLSP